MAIDLLDYIPFAETLGIRITTSEKDLVIGEMEVAQALLTTGKILHGGATMAFADTLGAVAAFLNLPDGAKSTTTIESKTNFISAAPLGDKLIGTCTPIHIGRRMSVWQTEIVREDGKKVAVITQSQLVLT